MSPRWWSVALLFGWTLGSTVARAAAPASVPVQGVLLDEEGRALDGATTLTVLLYEAAEGGEPLHREVYQLEVDNGFFTVQLGSTTPLDLGLFVERTDVWLALQVADDAEMTPRLPIGTRPTPRGRTRPVGCRGTMW